MLTRSLLVLGSCGLLTGALLAHQPAVPPGGAPFRNAALPIEQRVDAILSAMTLDDPRAVVLGKEPIWHGDDVVSYVTSANHGFSIGRGIVYGYLPSAIAQEDTPVEVEYFGERVAATVAADPLFDPKGARLKN